MTYHHLVTSSMDPNTPTPECVEKARATWLCPGCGLPRPGTSAVDVQLDAPAEDVPLNIVFGVGVGIIRRDLLDALGQDAVVGNLHVGQVSGPDGTRLRDYATFRGRRMALIRGDVRSMQRTCGSCGRLLYFPMGKRYLAGPFTAFDLAESQANQLIVSARIRDRVVATKWRKLTIQVLPVRERPLDGQVHPTLVEN